MINLTILGTSASAPTINRGLSSASIENNGSIYLFDCGEGTQRQMLKFKINISKIKCIFITHTHADHVLGIAGLIRTFELYGRDKPLNIYVPSKYTKIVDRLINLDGFNSSYKINVIPVEKGVIYKDKYISITAFPLIHSIQTFGYVFKENRKRNFIKSKCAKLGIKGPMFKDLEKKGFLNLNGKTIDIKEVSKITEGKKIVYATDTYKSNETIKAAKNSDIIIHEATYTDKYIDLAIERGHSTASCAAKVAKESKSKLLILFHFSTRYKNLSVHSKEAKKIFKNTKIVKDGYKINL